MKVGDQIQVWELTRDADIRYKMYDLTEDIIDMFQDLKKQDLGPYLRYSGCTLGCVSVQDL